MLHPGRLGVEHPWNVWSVDPPSRLVDGEFRALPHAQNASPPPRNHDCGRTVLGDHHLLVAVRYRVSTAFVVLLGSYVLSGPLEAIVRRKRIKIIDDGDLTIDELFGEETRES